MSNHTGKYLKPARRMTCPAVVFSIAVQDKSSDSQRSTHYENRVIDYAVATFTRKRAGKWSLPKTITTDNMDELRQWIHNRADSKRRNYVVCPIASEVLTLTQWWSYAESRGIGYCQDDENDKDRIDGASRQSGVSVRRCLLRGTPDIFDYSDANKRYVWLSGRQYTDITEAELAESIGYKPEQTGLLPIDWPLHTFSPYDRALLWSQFFCQLSNWWADSATAPFGLTIGSMAMGILRSYTNKKALCTHEDTYGHDLERRASYGGRASVWYVGAIGSAPIQPIHRESTSGLVRNSRIRGPLRLCDVRSMYPYLLRERMFPTHYAGRCGTLSADEARALCEHYGLIANVILYSQTGEYPHRTAKGVHYPTGTFQTVLTGPEIISIRSPDRLIRVIDGVTYRLGRPYQSASNALLDMRLVARKQRNLAWELFAKSVANNLGGKLAQRRSIWKPVPEVVPAVSWGEWYTCFMDSHEKRRYRARAGLVEQYIQDEGGYGPYTASFAYLTAYGRILMRSIRELLPPQSIVSQDTDGIWVIGNDNYNRLLDTYPFGNDPGQLAIKEQTDNAIFLGPRHYWTDKGWTLAGFHDFRLDEIRMMVQDSYTYNPLIGGARAAPSSICTRSRSNALVLDIHSGTVDGENWVHPTYIHTELDT